MSFIGCFGTVNNAARGAWMRLQRVVEHEVCGVFYVIVDRLLRHGPMVCEWRDMCRREAAMKMSACRNVGFHQIEVPAPNIG